MPAYELNEDLVMNGVVYPSGTIFDSTGVAGEDYEETPMLQIDVEAVLAAEGGAAPPPAPNKFKEYEPE